MKDAADQTGTTLDATAAPEAAPAAVSVGTSIGSFTVLEELGEGGMGVVVTAHDPNLDRKVAIKVLRAHGDSELDHSRNQRFLREAQALGRLAHPNVVTVFEVGVDNDRPFIVMERVDGDDLAAWLRTERPGWKEIVGAYIQAARGVAACHEVGLVHRDVKPSNILIDRQGRARISDFGLVRSAEHTEEIVADAPTTPAGPLQQTLTNDGAILGTPAYAAPEQLRGEPADARADQFSLCVSLHEGVYGSRPGSHRPAKPAVDAEAAPASLRAVLDRGMSLDPDARFADMNALIAALEGVVEPARARWQRPVALIGAVALIAAAIVGWRLTRDEGEAPARPAAEQPPAATTRVAPEHAAIDALENRGHDAIGEDRPADAVKLFEKALVLAEKADPLVHARVLSAHSFALSEAGRWPEAKKQILAAIAIYDGHQKKEPRQHVDAYHSLGVLGIETGDTRAAVVAITKAIALFEKYGINAPSDLANYWDNLGVASGAHKDHAAALEQHQRAFEIRKQAKLVAEYPDSYRKLVGVYTALGNTKKARHYRALLGEAAPPK